MRVLLLGLVVLNITTTCVFAKSAASRRCAELLVNGLTTSETFILQATQKFYRLNHLPKANTATYRLIGTVAEFSEVLAEYKLTIEEWRSVEGVEFEKPVLGTKDFIRAVNARQKGPNKLTEAQIEIFKKLNDAADGAREKLKAILYASEQLSFEDKLALNDESDLNQILQRFSRVPDYNLSYLGIEGVEGWRHHLFTEQEGIRKAIEKSITDAFRQAVAATNEIPESDDVILGMIAEKSGVPLAVVASYFGEKRIFKNVEELIRKTTEKYAGSFTKVINRRFFTEERRQKMLLAVGQAENIVLFRLAENQDLKDAAAIKALARALNAPIIVAPPFSEIGKIPQKLDWLFNDPDFHFMVDRGIQLTKDFYVVDHGYEDKRQNPFIGMDRIYEPTDRVILFHPRVKALTRATGNYDTHPGYFMTTGSMSDPAYFGKFSISMSTDERAQLEAERNRSVVVLSRKYKSKQFGRLVGSANGIAPRRVRFTEAMYGNPAGLFDLGKIYTDTGPFELKAIPAMILGDIHLGNTDLQFLAATHEAMEFLRIVVKNPAYGQAYQPEYIRGPVHLGAMVLHDLIDGGPNNGHYFGQMVTRAIEDQNGHLDLENHIKYAASYLKQLCQLLPDTNFVIPLDNHGSDWLMKRLQQADFQNANRPAEIPLLLRLMLEAITEKVNPYKRIFQYYGVDTDRVLFMEKADTYRVGIDIQDPSKYKLVQGIEVGQHSHMGISGAKSISLGKLLTAYGANVTGHTHSSAEDGTSLKVGTGTAVRQSYHRGPSNSDASIAIAYSETAMQLLRMERGSFIPNGEHQDPREFFPSPEYPRLLIRKMPPGGPQTDQYRANPPTDRGGVRRPLP